MLIIDKEETAKAQSWEAVIPCMCLKEITNPVNEGLDGGKFKNSPWWLLLLTFSKRRWTMMIVILSILSWDSVVVILLLVVVQ